MTWNFTAYVKLVAFWLIWNSCRQDGVRNAHPSLPLPKDHFSGLLVVREFHPSYAEITIPLQDATLENIKCTSTYGFCFSVNYSVGSTIHSLEIPVTETKKLIKSLMLLLKWQLSVHVGQTEVERQACLYLQNTSWQGLRVWYEIASPAQQIIISITVT